MKIRYEHIGDVSTPFGLLEVFKDGSQDPFMDIFINPDESIQFNFYQGDGLVSLSENDWEDILGKARLFKNEVVENERQFRASLDKEDGPLR